MAQPAEVVSGDFALTMVERRAVTGFVVSHAAEVLEVFEREVPGDARPRAAVEAAIRFVEGERRSRLQRVASVDAHRAAHAATSEAARLAARCAGDAAAAPYLHPIAQATQVGHILRAAASAARIAELEAGGDARVGDARLDTSRQRASGVLVDVLRRYPSPPRGTSRVSRLMHALDESLRAAAD